jgi:hypothetical protein
MKSACIFLFFTLCITLLAEDSTLPPEMQQILSRHFSFVVPAADGNSSPQRIYMGVAQYRDRHNQAFWLSINPDNYLEIYDCSKPENICFTRIPLTVTPVTDIVTNWNFAYLLSGNQLLVMDLTDPLQPASISETEFDNQSEPVQLWAKDDRLFILIDGISGSQMEIYSLQNPHKPEPKKQLALSITSPQYFYIRDNQITVVSSSGNKIQMDLNK